MKRMSCLSLPDHPARRYAPVGECIYCGSTDCLTKEHIIPYSAGGNWVLPASSCQACAKITGAFEGEVSRTILGPLRMLYNMPTRRPQERPDHLPLQVKYPDSTDWEIAHVDRSICPFLIGLPVFPMPEVLTGISANGRRDAAASDFWLRGGGFWPDKDAHLQWLCEALGAVEVMPAATVHVEPFCLTLAKIAHSFATAELGLGAFEPFLRECVRKRDMSERARFIGGGAGNEQPSSHLHELHIDEAVGVDPAVIAVRVRLLGQLGTPSYHVAVGRRP